MPIIGIQNHDTHLSRGTKKQRVSTRDTGSIGGKAWCDQCRQPVKRFGVEPIYGRTTQDCGCGNGIPMRRHVEMPVEVPAAVLEPRRETWGWDACASCGKRYQRSPKNTTNGCSRPCQDRIRESQRPKRVRSRVTCLGCGVSRQRAILGSDGRCARCRRGEHYRSRRLARIAARAA